MHTVTPYDSLIVAAGAQQSYFGNDDFAAFAPGMKSIDDALELRGRILGAFEAAEVATDRPSASGGSPLSWSARDPPVSSWPARSSDWPSAPWPGHFGPSRPATAGSSCSTPRRRCCRRWARSWASTHARLEKMGVEIQLNAMVTAVDYNGITIKDQDGTNAGSIARARCGRPASQASPLGKMIADQSDGPKSIARKGNRGARPHRQGPPERLRRRRSDVGAGVPGMAQGAIQGAHTPPRDQARSRARRSGQPQAVQVLRQGHMARSPATAPSRRSASSSSPASSPGWPGWCCTCTT